MPSASRRPSWSCSLRGRLSGWFRTTTFLRASTGFRIPLAARRGRRLPLRPQRASGDRSGDGHPPDAGGAGGPRGPPVHRLRAPRAASRPFEPGADPAAPGRCPVPADLRAHGFGLRGGGDRAGRGRACRRHAGPGRRWLGKHGRPPRRSGGGRERRRGGGCRPAWRQAQESRRLEPSGAAARPEATPPMERRGPAALPAPPLAIGRVPRRGQDLARAGPRRAARLGQHEDPALPGGRRDQPEAARGRFLRPILCRRHGSDARNAPFRAPGAAGRAWPPHARPRCPAPRSKTPLRPAPRYTPESSEGRVVQQPRLPTCSCWENKRRPVMQAFKLKGRFASAASVAVRAEAADGGAEAAFRRDVLDRWHAARREGLAAARPPRWSACRDPRSSAGKR